MRDNRCRSVSFIYSVQGDLKNATRSFVGAVNFVRCMRCLYLPGEEKAKRMSRSASDWDRV